MHPGGLADAHLHFSDAAQAPALAGYCRRFGLTGLGMVSLPDLTRLNFNPESAYGKAVLPDLVEQLAVYAFGGFDYSALFHDAEDEELDLAEQVRTLAALGFDGLKLWAGKPHLQARTGLRLDDPVYTAAFREAARHGMPAVIHLADPPSFWSGEVGGINAELGIDYRAPGVPSFEELQRQAEAICELNPETIFIFAHLLFRAGDLPGLGTFLERHPNARLDLAPGLYFYGELSRRREEARAFFDSFRDRILYGTDGFWFAGHHTQWPRRSPEENATAAKRLLDFLRTDEEFDNPFEPGREELPRVSGLALPREVLDSVLRENLRRLCGDSPAPLDPAALDPYLAHFLERLRSVGADERDIESVRAIRQELRTRKDGGN